MDILRIDKGLIFEHWYVEQAVPAQHGQWLALIEGTILMLVTRPGCTLD